MQTQVYFINPWPPDFSIQNTYIMLQITLIDPHISADLSPLIKLTKKVIINQRLRRK